MARSLPPTRVMSHWAGSWAELGALHMRGWAAAGRRLTANVFTELGLRAGVGPKDASGAAPNVVHVMRESLFERMHWNKLTYSILDTLTITRIELVNDRLVEWALLSPVSDVCPRIARRL